jgi:hypothetical protein
MEGSNSYGTDYNRNGVADHLEGSNVGYYGNDWNGNGVPD